MRLRQIGIVALALLVAGCIAPSSGTQGSGNFEILVSDAPAYIDDFDSLEVSFSKARVFSGSNDDLFGGSGEEDFQEIIVGNRTVDLTQVIGEKAQPLARTNLEPGNYSKIDLYASNIRGIVDGEEVEVKIPPGKLMINKDFEIKPNTTTEFVFDINVVLRGNAQNNQGYILKPVISKSGIAGKDVDVERTDR